MKHTISKIKYPDLKHPSWLVLGRKWIDKQFKKPCKSYGAFCVVCEAYVALCMLEHIFGESKKKK